MDERSVNGEAPYPKKCLELKPAKSALGRGSSACKFRKPVGTKLKKTERIMESSPIFQSKIKILGTTSHWRVARGNVGAVDGE